MKIYYITKKPKVIFWIILIITISMIFLLSKIKENVTEVSQNINNSLNLMDTIIKNNEEKTAYLTFDDGPTQVATPTILDILKEENVKATFFVIGKNVEKNAEIIKREYEEGHYIANHGYDHDNYVLYKDNESFINEINKTDEAIGKVIGVNNYCSHIFRFPNGYMAPINKARKKEVVRLLNEINYKYIDWNCLNNDSEKKYTAQELLNNLKETSKNKNILVILMHDTKDVSDSSSVLKESIEYLKEMGYQFKNFYDLNF